jgi:hypothetical protein
MHAATQYVCPEKPRYVTSRHVTSRTNASACGGWERTLLAAHQSAAQTQSPHLAIGQHGTLCKTPGSGPVVSIIIVVSISIFFNVTPKKITKSLVCTQLISLATTEGAMSDRTDAPHKGRWRHLTEFQSRTKMGSREEFLITGIGRDLHVNPEVLVQRHLVVLRHLVLCRQVSRLFLLGTGTSTSTSHTSTTVAARVVAEDGHLHVVPPRVFQPLPA